MTKQQLREEIRLKEKRVNAWRKLALRARRRGDTARAVDLDDRIEALHAELAVLHHALELVEAGVNKGD